MPPCACADQRDATQDERAHDNLADVRLGADHLAKIGTLDPDHTTIGAGPGGHQNLLIVEQVELAGELPLTCTREDLRLTLFILIENFDVAVEHQEEVDTALAALKQKRPLTQPLLYAVVRNAVCGIDAQPRKRLRLARVRIGRVDLRLGRDESVKLNRPVSSSNRTPRNVLCHRLLG